MKNSVSKVRYYFFLITTLFVFSAFVYRLVDWQILNGEYYRRRANFNNIYSIPIEAARGEILDANGEDFAVNEVIYQVSFDRFNAKNEELSAEINFLLDLFSQRNEEYIDELPICLEKNGECSFMKDAPGDNKMESEIKILKSSEILNLNNYATASDCYKNLFLKYKVPENKYDKERERQILSVLYSMDKAGFWSSRSKFFAFSKNNISREMLSIVSEISRTNPCYKITSKMKRTHKNSVLMPHIIGAVGKLTQEDYTALKSKGYGLNDEIGQFGLERSMESELRGKNGKKTVETTKEGRIVSQLNNEEVVHGKTIYLTIDSELQKVAQESVERNVSISESGTSGGVIVIRVKDFAILACAGYPSFDIERYSDKNYYKDLVTDTQKKPLVNRAINYCVEPGSVVKPAVACAALNEGIINFNTKINCRRGIVIPGTNKFTRCMGHHNETDVIKGIVQSCNSFFLYTGSLMGIDIFDKYAHLFGLGEKTGVEVPESSGSLASPKNRKSKGGTWFVSDPAYACIGQSDNLFSPLQLAVYVATIANDGKRLRPHFIKKITNYNRTETLFENSPENPEVVADLGVKQEYLDKVKEAMYLGSTIGIGRSYFKSFPVPVALKTGTAQNPSNKDHKNFIGWAPCKDNEKFGKDMIAIASTIERGGTFDHRYKDIARDLFRAYFKV
ncbi:MAG: hypothetical protein LBT82_01965 [Oscillospiraceae bacterium]|jgi:penicillin-binding protein 2|nr:hypothetical protein [Oscillospiraceae bacterium]